MSCVSCIMIILVTVSQFGLLGSAEKLNGTWQQWPPTMCRVDRTELTEGHNVDVVIGGIWGGSCVPDEMMLRAEGTQVELSLTICNTGACLTVITPWTLGESAGPLPRGVYRVFVTPIGCEGEVLATAEGLCHFVVSDDDGDIDLMDYQIMSVCFESQGGAIWSGCELYDEDSSGQVDLADFAEFQVAFTGELP